MPALTLYQFPGESGLSLSPYCNKVHWALRLKGLPYRTHDLLFPRKISATGKLPVLSYDGERIHDSTEIIRALEARHPERPLIPHDPLAAARAHVLEAWADEAMHAVMLGWRWSDPASLTRLGAATFPSLPAPVAALAMRRPRAKIVRAHAQLFARGEGYLRDELARDLDALDALLSASGEWLVEDTQGPTVADVSVAAQVHMLALEKTSPAWAMVQARERVARWLDRFLARASRVAE